ncbi:GMC oxidoreductase [Immersiella caudata]|uniref:GMC oxidoreductase n=1 Tax=Immersiella caudata TaxID=314043 RepID=A0AA39WLV4_9PEZI|nr:GMC oxidoreductase [Immersiella caudata]
MMHVSPWALAAVLLGASPFVAAVDENIAIADATAESTVKAPGPKFDFIVVGGGTAGSTLATRLSLGLPWASVLLIEAGPSALGEDRINIPGRKGSTLGTVYDWNFTTTTQPGARNRVFAAPRGKVLGGSSALNLMSWDRASAPEYDAWGSLGNAGWSWDSMIATMTKAETFTPSAHYGSQGVGSTGPIKTVINRFIPEQQNSWIPTMNNLGIPLNRESLGGNPLGVMYQPSNIDSTVWNRSYAANGYLAQAGPNLHVLTNTRVAKINLAAKSPSSSRVATGVTLQNGTVISAREEVVLSAGSIQSPGLLELSGIGRQDVLSTAGVSQVIDLPGVGENLQDHIRIQASYELKGNYKSFDMLRYNTTFATEQLNLWRQGQLSMYDYTGSAYTFMNWDQAVGTNASAVLKSLARSVAGTSISVIDQKRLSFLSNPAVPQLEVIFSDGYTGVKGYPLPDTPLYGKNFFTLIAAVMHPLSRGSVHITSSNISTHPTLNPNYLSNEYDVQAAMTAIKYVRRIANTPPMSDLWVTEYEPGLVAVPDAANNDALWRDFVTNTTLSIFHPVGTCAMLPRSQGGVVDAKLTVYGTTNLRVVDASVMPVLISGHIQTAVYGIAERAAEIMIGSATRYGGGKGM